MEKNNIVKGVPTVSAVQREPQKAPQEKPTAPPQASFCNLQIYTRLIYVQLYIKEYIIRGPQFHSQGKDIPKDSGQEKESKPAPVKVHP